MTCLERIKELLDERGWSMYTLSRAAGIPQSTLSNLFIRCNDPSIATLEKICSALGISLSEFFAEPTAREETRYADLLREWDRLSPSARTHFLALMKEYRRKE
mgnify:CR=1 FL=1